MSKASFFLFMNIFLALSQSQLMNEIFLRDTKIETAELREFSEFEI